MKEHKNSYLQIIKSTFLFGGVQFFNVLIGLIRTKFIALYVGTIGVGLFGLFGSALNLIGTIIGLGLETSAVKTITENQNNELKLVNEISVLKKLIYVTSIVGLIITIILSPLLSKVSFGNFQYTYSFFFLSLSILFKQLTSGNLIIFQGIQKLDYLAKANLLGNFIGFIVSIPIIFFLKINSIVLLIIISSAITYLISYYYFKKLKIILIPISFKKSFTESMIILKLGFYLSIMSLLTSLSAYLLQIFINYKSGIATVGVFAAGMTILNNYVGLIFNAMATDYYPRLTKVSSDNIQLNKIVKEQSLIAVLLLTPIIVCFLIFAPYIIRLFYSKEFLPVLPLLTWGILGMLFKSLSWSLGYIIIAKGDSNVFLKTSIGFNTLFLFINILGYAFFGIEGLGIAFFINYIIHFVGLSILTSKKYLIKYDNQLLWLFIFSFIICLFTFICINIKINPFKTILLSILALISILFSVYQLNKRIHLKEFLKSKI